MVDGINNNKYVQCVINNEIFDWNKSGIYTK